MMFASPRALLGIWGELRRLRRLTESYFVSKDIPLPASAYERLRERLALSGSSGGSGGTVVLQPPTEDQLVEERLRRLNEDIALGRDPETDYRPWE
jgi:hypothetical protein